MKKIINGKVKNKGFNEVKGARDFINVRKKRRKRRKIRNNLLVFTLLIIAGSYFALINKNSLLPKANPVESVSIANDEYLKKVVNSAMELKEHGLSGEDICVSISARYPGVCINLTESNIVEIGCYVDGELEIISSFPIN